MHFLTRMFKGRRWSLGNFLDFSSDLHKTPEVFALCVVRLPQKCNWVHD